MHCSVEKFRALRTGLITAWSTFSKISVGDVIVGQHHVSASSTAKQRSDVVDADTCRLRSLKHVRSKLSNGD